MRALEDDRYVRQTEGYLPTANVAFVDEIFKANSAILNTLLTVLNERLFDNGTKRELVPLLCLVMLCTLDSADAVHAVRMLLIDVLLTLVTFSLFSCPAWHQLYKLCQRQCKGNRILRLSLFLVGLSSALLG